MEQLRNRYQQLKERLTKSNILFHICFFIGKTKNLIGSALMYCWLSLIDLVYLRLLQKIRNLTGNSFKSFTL
jgi:hypothetical protein